MTFASTPSARRLLATSVLAVATVIMTGCDDLGEQNAITVNAETSAARAAGASTIADQNKAIADKLAAVSSGSEGKPAVIIAQQNLGQVRLTQAASDAAQLTRLESSLQHLYVSAGRRAHDALASHTLANNYRGLNPSQSVAEIEKLVGQARGDGNAATFAADENASVSIPTLAAVKQRKSELEGEAAKIQSAIDAATSARDAALAEAGRVSATLETQTGAVRVDTVTQLTEARARAATAARELSVQNGLLTRANGELAEQNALIAELDATIASLNSQGNLLTSGFAAVTAKASEQDAIAKRLIDGTDGQTVAALAAEVAELQKEVSAKREEVVDGLQSAIDAFSGAAAKATTLHGELSSGRSGSPMAYEADAWKKLESAVAVDRMNLGKAEAMKALADVHAEHARSLAENLKAAELIEAAGNAVRSNVSDVFSPAKLKEDLKAALTEAAEAYETAEQTFDGVNFQNSDLDPLKPVKYVSRVLILNRQAELAELAQKHGIDLKIDAKAKRDDARAMLVEARESNVRLPAIPESLGGLPPEAFTPTAPDAPTDTPTPTDDTATPDDPTTAQVRAAAASLNDLLVAGNADDVKAVAILEEGGEEQVAEAIQASATFARFRAALTEKFPDNPGAQQIVDLIAKQLDPKTHTFVIQDDKAFVAPVTEGEWESFRLVDGAWKPVLANPRTEAGQAKLELDRKVIAAISTLADDIEAGTLTDLTEIPKRMAEATGITPPADAPAP